jgi:hypothetical protein
MTVPFGLITIKQPLDGAAPAGAGRREPAVSRGGGGERPPDRCGLPLLRALLPHPDRPPGRALWGGVWAAAASGHR